MQIHDTFQLTYCTNIHPGSDWKETFTSLRENVPAIRQSVAGDEWFGIGLRLSNKASEELGLDETLKEFKDWLDLNKLYVFTMNGFPYGNFHHQPVKDQVHAPDWTSSLRLEYTIRLFNQLAYLLPETLRGGISTSPVSYRHWHPEAEQKETAFRQGAENLARVVLHLHALENETEKYMHLDIEPEPDGLLENTRDVLEFFRDYLLPVSIPVLVEELEVNEDEAAGLVLRYITLCYDTCHFALAFEEPYQTFASLAAAGIKVGKIQLSAALKILPGAKDNKTIWEDLNKFVEPVYLHQVTELISEDEVRTYPDLPDLLAAKNDFTELRAHFHVPVFIEKFETLYSTQDQIRKTLAYISDHPISEHLEVETYTWDVLPDGLKTDLQEMVARELQWVLKTMGE